MKWKACLAVIGIVVCSVIFAANQQAKKRPVDKTKRRVETPVKNVLAARRLPAATANDVPAVRVERPGAAKDFRKDVIESPIKNVLVNSGANDGTLAEDLEATIRELQRAVRRRPADMEKGFIERPTERVLAKGTAPEIAPEKNAPFRTAEFENPKVAPGNVKWHASFKDACAASRKSGKPVLLFQMMGNLDDRFC